MASSWSRTINGFRIYMHLWVGGEVAFDCADADFDNPLFVDALKQAVAMYPYGAATARLWHESTHRIEHSSIDKKHELMKLVEMMKEGIRLGYIDESDQPTEILNALNGIFPEKDISKRTIDLSGFVYVLRAESGHYKIGRTKSPDSRMKTFSVKLPFRVEYELLIRSDNCRELEKGLHARFSDRRVDGEWFALSPEDIEALKQEYGNIPATE